MCVVYRYEGESKKEVENETNNFSELLKKIEERKRQRAVASNKSILDQDRNNLEEPKKKKKKKLLKTEKTDESHIEDETASSEKINEQVLETAKVSTKKKKKKKKDIESDDLAIINKNKDLEEKDKNLTEENDKDTTEKEVPSQSNFIILGARSRKKQPEVKRVLPDWLAHPEVISADLNSGPTLEDMESILDTKLVEILRANDIVKLFPVQSSIIKWLHKCKMDRRLGWWPRDTCVSAPTGSGKYL